MIKKILKLLGLVNHINESVQKEHVRERANYDFSTKPFEVLCKTYMFDKYSRIIKNKPNWLHYKYYQTSEGANDALKLFRKNNRSEDYPCMGKIENETKYPHIKPTIIIRRFKVIKRDFKKPYN